MTKYSFESIVLHLKHSPQQVVSLVPSVTETLIAFGLSDRIVGVTDFCPSDVEGSMEPVRLGGTKSPDVEGIIRLKPDLVIVNQEENTPDAVQALEEANILIWLTFPKSVNEAIEDLWAITRIFHQERHLAPRIEILERSLEWTRLAVCEYPLRRYFCPIWVGEDLDWWMTFNQNTYAGDILTSCGGENVFADRERRYPLEADLGLQPAVEVTEQDTRYPRVTPAEVIAAKPDIIFLPSEPHAFDSKDAEKLSTLLADTPAVKAKEIHFIDGRLFSWHGIHIAEALRVLPPYFHRH